MVNIKKKGNYQTSGPLELLGGKDGGGSDICEFLFGAGGFRAYWWMWGVLVVLVA